MILIFTLLLFFTAELRTQNDEFAIICKWIVSRVTTINYVCKQSLVSLEYVECILTAYFFVLLGYVYELCPKYDTILIYIRRVVTKIMKTFI